jgi:hypothetical protein
MSVKAKIVDLDSTVENSMEISILDLEPIKK